MAENPNLSADYVADCSGCEKRRGEEKMTAALRRFGWTCGPEFWQRYYSDPWVFNLANAVERLTDQLEEAQLRSIEARNPGIDMDEVRRTRAARNDGQDSGVARARPEGAVEAERRQDQAEPCNTAPPTNDQYDGSGGGE